jgi:hypothetical protein
MSTVLIIVLGVVAVTVVSVLGDMATKIAQAKAKGREGPKLPAGEISRLQDRLSALEARAEERDESVRKLQDELRFVSRMLEDKSGSGAAN